MLGDVEPLELSVFEPLVGQTFVCSLKDTDLQFEAVLTEAKPIKSAKVNEDDRDPFALNFKFPPEAEIDQASFDLRAASGQEFPSVFLVAADADETGRNMNASFA